uniref:Zinc finger AN1-type containing 6 n=1 Tax=Scleropages formosus TaxID=113540 RepID=A0A8C9V4Z3_SCLFO
MGGGAHKVTYSIGRVGAGSRPDWTGPDRSRLRTHKQAQCERCYMRDMAQETNQTQGPMLCTTGCGFYGNPRTNGMCSVCYKDYLQRQNNNGRVSPSASSGVCTVGESLPMQFSDSGVVLLAPASSTIGGTQEPSSVVSSQTLLSQASVAHSEEEESAVDKAGLKTDQLQAPVPDDSDRPIVEDQDPSPNRPKKQKNRCFVCRKKVGLTGATLFGFMFCFSQGYQKPKVTTMQKNGKKSS